MYNLFSLPNPAVSTGSFGKLFKTVLNSHRAVELLHDSALFKSTIDIDIMLVTCIHLTESNYSIHLHGTIVEYVNDLFRTSLSVRSRTDTHRKR